MNVCFFNTIIINKNKAIRWEHYVYREKEREKERKRMRQGERKAFYEDDFNE